MQIRVSSDVPVVAVAASDQACRLYVEGDDRRTRRLRRRLEQALVEVVVIDIRDDADGAAFIERLACCGRRTPTVAVAGLVLIDPDPDDVVAQVRSRAPKLLGAPEA